MPLLTLRIEDEGGVPIQDAKVEFYDAAGGFLGVASTNANGEASLAVQGGDFGRPYHLRYWKLREGELFGKLEDFYGKASVMVFNNDVTYKAKIPAAGTYPSNPRLCRLTITQLTLAGKLLPYMEFSSLETPAVVEGMWLQPFGRSDEAYIDLPREGIFLVNAPGLLKGPKKVKVPNEPKWKIEDLLWPYITSLSFDVPSLSMVVGEEKEVGFSFSMSTTYAEDPNNRPYYFYEYGEFRATTNAFDVALISNSAIIIKARRQGSGEVLAFNIRKERYPNEPIVHTPLNVVVS